MASPTSDLGYLALTVLASAGFAVIAVARVRLALESRRRGDRLEMTRSSLVAVVMVLFAIAAGFGAFAQIARLVLSPR